MQTIAVTAPLQRDANKMKAAGLLLIAISLCIFAPLSTAPDETTFVLATVFGLEIGAMLFSFGRTVFAASEALRATVMLSYCALVYGTAVALSLP